MHDMAESGQEPEHRAGSFCLADLVQDELSPAEEQLVGVDFGDYGVGLVIEGDLHLLSHHPVGQVVFGVEVDNSICGHSKQAVLDGD